MILKKINKCYYLYDDKNLLIGKFPHDITKLRLSEENCNSLYNYVIQKKAYSITDIKFAFNTGINLGEQTKEQTQSIFDHVIDVILMDYDIEVEISKKTKAGIHILKLIENDEKAIEIASDVLKDIPEWSYLESHSKENALVDEGEYIKIEDVYRAFGIFSERLKEYYTKNNEKYYYKGSSIKS